MLAMKGIGRVVPGIVVRRWPGCRCLPRQFLPVLVGGRPRPLTRLGLGLRFQEQSLLDDWFDVAGILGQELLDQGGRLIQLFLVGQSLDAQCASPALTWSSRSVPCRLAGRETSGCSSL